MRIDEGIAVREPRSISSHIPMARRLLFAVTAILTVFDPLRFADVPQRLTFADADKPAENDRTPLAVYLTVSSPINDAMAARITNAAVKLQHQADQENRPAFLVLEIGRGTSRFGQVRDLAKELRSARLSKVRTIAWIPKPEDGKQVDGYHVILALACNEIIMHPDAEMGDIGRGAAPDLDEQQAVISLVEDRHNTKVSRALALGLMDPQKMVLKITVEVGEGDNKVAESRIVTLDELERLKTNKTVILDTKTIKDAGVAGTFTASRARAWDVLVVQTADSRSEIADLYNIPQESLREDPTLGDATRARLIKIEGVIEPILEDFVDREIRRAVNSQANMIIFEIDSPGGSLLSSTNLANRIANDLDPKKIRTVAYIPKLGLSGAAIIALGCDEIYMGADAQIGDAEPIELKEGGQFERAPEKILSHLTETLKVLAEKKGRPPALAEAMADKDLVVYEVTHKKTGRVWYMSDDEIHNSNGEWDKGQIVPESKDEKLLTVPGKRAHELKLAEAPVADWDELKQRLGIPQDVQLTAAACTWVDTLVYVMNSGVATFLLIVAGLACIYLEFYTMTGFFGIGSALCFSLFFWSRVLGGTAGWLEVVLFLFGLALIALEVFVIPGFGVFGISGGLSILAGLVLASQTFVVPETGPQMTEMTWTMATLSASVVSVIVLAVVMSRFLPQMPLLKHMILAPPNADSQRDPDAPRLSPEYSDEVPLTSFFERHRGLLQQRGVAISVLRPAGKAQIGDQYVDVISDGPYISSGSEIEVVAVTGNRVVVRQV